MRRGGSPFPAPSKREDISFLPSSFQIGSSSFPSSSSSQEEEGELLSARCVAARFWVPGQAVMAAGGSGMPGSGGRHAAGQATSCRPQQCCYRHVETAAGAVAAAGCHAAKCRAENVGAPKAKACQSKKARPGGWGWEGKAQGRGSGRVVGEKNTVQFHIAMRKARSPCPSVPPFQVPPPSSLE